MVRMACVHIRKAIYRSYTLSLILRCDQETTITTGEARNHALVELSSLRKGDRRTLVTILGPIRGLNVAPTGDTPRRLCNTPRRGHHVRLPQPWTSASRLLRVSRSRRSNFGLPIRKKLYRELTDLMVSKLNKNGIAKGCSF
jgi:hypothetical protein